jgi:hypothetical protein
MRGFVLPVMVVATWAAVLSQERAEIPKQQDQLTGASIPEPASSGPSLEEIPKQHDQLTGACITEPARKALGPSLIDCTHGVACPIVSPGWCSIEIVQGSEIEIQN